MCRNITELRGLEQVPRRQPPATVPPRRRPEVRARLGLAAIDALLEH